MQEDVSRIPNEKRTAQTRAALIAAARKVFAEQGYAGSATPDIVKAAGVTRGALYHHFDDKRALFEAVLEAESQAVAKKIDAASREAGSPMEALKMGALAYFDAMRFPGRTRLLLIDGPAALGAEKARAVDDAAAGDTLLQGLKAAASAGELRNMPLEPLAALLNAVFDRAALEIVGGMNRQDVETTVDALLDGLCASSRGD